MITCPLNIRIILNSLIILLLYVPIHAQENDRDEDFFDRELRVAKKGFFGHAHLGGSFLDLDAVNSALADQNYQPMGESYFALGFGLTRVSQKWVLEADLYNFMIRESSLTLYTQQSLLGFHYFLARGGFIAYRNENQLIIYPTIGIGGGGGKLQLKPLFQRQAINHWSFGPLVDASVNVRYFTEMADMNGNMIEWGFQLGFLYAPGDYFQLKRLVPDSSVTVQPSGLYFRLTLGMGKFK